MKLVILIQPEFGITNVKPCDKSKTSIALITDVQVNSEKLKMSTIRDSFVADMKSAMKNKDKFRLLVIRMALAAFRQKEIDEKITITDDEVLSIIIKMIKQRKDSAEQFEHAGRNELAQKETEEIEVLQSYLPKPLSEEAIIEIVQKAISNVGASSAKDMGIIMAKIKAKLHGRADMSKVSFIVKSQLS